MIHYKGKGEHSVKQLEELVEERNEKLYQLNISRQVLLKELTQKYVDILKGRKDILFLNKHRYYSLKQFCIECSLLSLDEIEKMEYEVNQESI